jgi:effector-binding domain-containing protein
MLTEPRIVSRTAQPYVAISNTLSVADIPRTLPPLFPEIGGWIARHGAAPAGAPFFRYRTIDMPGRLVIEVGFPVAKAMTGDARMHADVLPAGRYASLINTGPYDKLVDANAALLKWGSAQGLKWAVSKTEAGEQWESRLEIYLTDPTAEPDAGKWETEIAFLLA